MKKRVSRAVLPSVLFLLLAGTVLLLSSCFLTGLFGTTAQARVNQFKTAITNANYDILYTYFHPDNTTMYDQIKNAAYWDNTPFAEDLSPEIDHIGTTVFSGDQALVEADVVNSTGTLHITFTLSAIGDDFYIERIDFEDSFYDVYNIRKIGFTGVH